MNEVAVIHTNQGDMVIKFWPEVAPNTVKNFTDLARKGFYDGTAFHRIVKGFMIQGGDPLSKEHDHPAVGTGGPGHKVKAEFNERPHVRGVISMANAGPNTNGSQFFITHVPTPHLDGKHTVFGKVTKGQDVVDAIRQGDVMRSVKVAE